MRQVLAPLPVVLPVPTQQTSEVARMPPASLDDDDDIYICRITDAYSVRVHYCKV